ncbi:MAG: hypothetical protein JWO46_2307, partial [Nocardioidaceae bacterium]|nr:hypothetical protein [Nocardioidaceae bacterium]
MSGPRILTALRRTGEEDERGYVAIVAVLMFASVMFGCAALGVDVARWYLEAQRVQGAADASALAGVTYMPMDLASATTTARTVSARNGYNDADATVSVTAEKGAKPSQLKVTVCSTIKNTFGAVLGYPTNTICRYAIADYTGPAPMGSPCNVFGNEPIPGQGTATGENPKTTALGSPVPTNCGSVPQFWAGVEGPATDKDQGDRFGTTGCSASSFDGCSSSKVNTEYNPLGYFFLIRVQPAFVTAGRSIDLQLYDPAFTNTGPSCANLPSKNQWTTSSPNDYVTDGSNRYSDDGSVSTSTNAPFCNGDYFVTGDTTDSSSLMVTSFAVRSQTDTLDPSRAPVQNDTGGSPCIKQYSGVTSFDPDYLTKTKTAYNDSLSEVFHNWNTLCVFKPTVAGDYYLQVRTNMSTSGGTAQTNSTGRSTMVWTGNPNVVSNAAGNKTSGNGVNSFAVRAVVPSGAERQVSVSGYDRMPIFENGTSAPAAFNLIRVVPAGAGKAISFTFFDAGDATGNGTVTVIPPADAKDSAGVALTSRSYAIQFPGACKALGGYAGTGATYTNCKAP